MVTFGLYLVSRLLWKYAEIGLLNSNLKDKILSIVKFWLKHQSEIRCSRFLTLFNSKKLFLLFIYLYTRILLFFARVFI